MATSALTTKSEQQSPQHQTPTKASPSSSSATTSIPQQSPRNTASSLPSTGTYVSFGPVEVSKALQDGEKFVKWDEVRFNLLYLSISQPLKTDIQSTRREFYISEEWHRWMNFDWILLTTMQKPNSIFAFIVLCVCVLSFHYTETLSEREYRKNSPFEKVLLSLILIHSFVW